jgi:tRNA(Ile)-lysidine synthase
LIPYLRNRTVLFELFRPFGIAEVSVNDLINVVKGKTGGRLMTGSHIILKNRDEIVVSPLHAKDDYVKIINNPRDLKQISQVESVRSVKVTESFKIPKETSSACIDEDKLLFPLVVRKWSMGDYFFPLGMKNRKKLSDYFTDKKYSLIDKDKALILESDGKIVCILGERIDDRFRITKETKIALIIKAARQVSAGR